MLHDARVLLLLGIWTDPSMFCFVLVLFGALLPAFGIASCLAGLRALELKLVALRWTKQTLANGALVNGKVFIIYVDTN